MKSHKLKKTFSFLFFLLILGFSTNVFSTTITLTPSGTDDATQIQTGLNSMVSGDIIQLNGDFIIKKTLYLPSNIKWILTGSISLGSGSTLDMVGWVGTVGAVSVDARRPTGIAEKNWNTTGSSGIDMAGGLYDGIYVNNSDGKRIRFINFVRVTNSNFHDFEMKKASDDNFTLGPGCNNNECRNIVSSLAGLTEGAESGNALTDKGDHNKWYDCIAKDCTSDGITPKCSYSEFYRCIADGNKGPGWGMYCRLDGGSKDAGTNIDNNKFIDCEAMNNKGSGFSFNISSTCGIGGTIRNNIVQARCYNNQESGVRFRNVMPESIVANNQIDLLCYGNKGLNTSGSATSNAGGLGTENGTNSAVTGITGSMVSYGNSAYDVNLGKATGCNITVYRPSGESAPTLKNGTANTIPVVNFACSDVLTAWSQQEYCGVTAILGNNDLHFNNDKDKSVNIYPNPLTKSTLTIKMDDFQDTSNVQVNIVNLLGQSVYQRSTNNAAKLEINTSGILKESIYFVSVEGGQSQVTRKLVVN